MAEWRMSAPLPEGQYLLHVSPKDDRPLQPRPLTRGWCLAVDFQDRLEASPLIPAGWSPALRFHPTGTSPAATADLGPGGPSLHARQRRTE